MSNAEFSQLIEAKNAAEAEHKADPANAEKLDRFQLAWRSYRHGLEQRHNQMYAEARHGNQFERLPDEGLL